ncbi:tRNA 5-methoxyuridine(34)/uridine 5-oxyacetic acid(34) synthase CmoB [Pseudomonadota bacterium]|nr:tRNA 5-methoxyuridine(34)/uridine 5-oxyacetic acid(34) synthase CmoB [Pseudomonadota bacterium]
MRISNLKQLAIEKVYDRYESDVAPELNQWLKSCIGGTKQKIMKNKKNIQRYEDFFDSLPIITGSVNVRNGTIVFDRSPDNNSDFKQQSSIKNLVNELIPWRKGPYNVMGVPIESEWNCSIKWDRLASKIPALENNVIMDVGSGNGYFAWRMREAGAKLVVCLEPNFASFIQFHFLNQFADDPKIRFVPMSLEESSKSQYLFDKIFIMGTLYHTKAPFEHIKSATCFLKKGGFLILETLIFKSDDCTLFVPRERYARMSNVWQIPSFLAVKSWLIALGFSNIELVSVEITTTAEQRATQHMPFKSLNDGLGQEDDKVTIESYPRPQRGIIVAQRTSDVIGLN